jgi:hypothetical protein
MSPVCRRYIACAERPYIRRFKHFLKLLDFVNDALDIHKLSIAKPSLQPITNVAPPTRICYHGFLFLDDVAVDGFASSARIPSEVEPGEAGSAFVVAPDEAERPEFRCAKLNLLTRRQTMKYQDELANQSSFHAQQQAS